MSNQQALTNKAFWDDSWKQRAPVRHVNPRRYLDYRFAKLFHAVLPRRQALALEPGAGASIWLTYMVKQFGYRVVGLDYSRLGCEMLAKNLGAARERALVIEGDIFQDCFPDHTFDVIFSNGLIEHFTDYLQVLRVFTRWLKPDGILLTFVPNKKYVFRHIERRIAPEVDAQHVLMEPGDLGVAYRALQLEQISAFYFGSFSTWKYTSYLKGISHRASQVASRVLCTGVQTVLRTTGAEPESKQFSPLIVAVGRVPRGKR